MLQLRLHDAEDFRVPVAAHVDAEAAEAVDELFAVDVGKAAALVRPLDKRRVGRYRFPVHEPARIDVVVVVVNRLRGHPPGFIRAELILFDPAQNILELFYRFLFTHCNTPYKYLICAYCRQAVADRPCTMLQDTLIRLLFVKPARLGRLHRLMLICLTSVYSS